MKINKFEEIRPFGPSILKFKMPKKIINNFNNAIEEIQQELNEEARNKLYKEFQNIIHGQAPYIFLCSSQERISINSRFEAQSYIARPGYNEKEFTLKNNLAETAQ